MEPMGAISEGEWGSLGEMYTSEEADFMAQLLSSCPGNPNEVNSVASFQGNSSSSCYWPSHEYSSIIQPNSVNENSPYYSFDIINNNTNSYYFSQGSSSNTSNGNVLFPRNSSQESFRLSHSNPVLENNSNTGNNCMTPLMDFCTADGTNTGSYLIEASDDCSNRETSGRGDANEEDQNQSGGIKYLELKSEDDHDQKKASESNKNNHKLTIPFETTFKKRCRSTGDLQAKNKRIAKPKKNGKSSVSKNYEKDEDEDDAGVNVNRQTSSSCCSEDDYLKNPNEVETSSLSSKGKAVISLSGKARASRGSATDPQSLYARKRRERINERLRILQTLVPNGTKVDISTMLEEAVQYVKFLQLQIKLLSSDDLWMYAPIAYNGMNLGLDLKLTPPS